MDQPTMAQIDEAPLITIRLTFSEAERLFASASFYETKVHRIEGPPGDTNTLTAWSALDKLAAAMAAVRCIACGCTDEDCSGCIARTGRPCSWATVNPPLCTACATTANECTGIAASWCPVHGDCSCPPAEPGHPRRINGEGCPLHSPTSDHG